MAKLWEKRQVANIAIAAVDTAPSADGMCAGVAANTAHALVSQPPHA
ncbi:hypothetical protein RugamoR57_49090 [Duganella caerulea]